MTTYPRSPKLLKGGIVAVDPQTGTVRRVIALQYNPESISRSFQINAAGESGDRSQAMRIKGPPVETINVEATIDATDMLEFPSDHPDAVAYGLHPQIAALETLIYPESAVLVENDALADSGTLEIAPMEAPLTLFVWSKSRVVPVRISELSVTEEAFDASLNPTRAKVSLGMRVLSVDDLGFDHRGGSLFLVHQQLKEDLASKAPAGVLDTLGIGGVL